VFNKAITLEFFIDGKKNVQVILNNTKKIPFKEFWDKTEDSQDMCRLIHDSFQKQYPKEYEAASIDSKNWLETFLKIINNHLRELDYTVDIFIRSNGEVTFNLEHPIK